MDNLKNKDSYLENKKIVLALSGGVDSIVMLDYLHRNYSNNLRAVHINHNLSINSYKWQKFCQEICKKLDIKLDSIDIQIENKSNLEENARNKRYLALTDRLKEDEILCTAHHQQDQVETLLLQLFRGCGVAGMAAMPKHRIIYEKEIYRPFLNITKAQIIKYAKDNKLKWIEDESNNDINLRRNLLRLEYIPKLAKIFKNLNANINRSAKHQSDALKLIQQLAQIDIEKHSLIKNGRLQINSLIKLDDIRMVNVIRYHIKQIKYLHPSEKVMQEIIALINSKEDSKALVIWEKYELRRFKNELFFINKKNNIPNKKCRYFDEFNKMPNFEIQFRQEGQRVKMAGKKHSQSLKKILQEANIPPWERQKLRMYYINGELKAMESIGKMSEIK